MIGGKRFKYIAAIPFSEGVIKHFKVFLGVNILKKAFSFVHLQRPMVSAALSNKLVRDTENCIDLCIERNVPYFVMETSPFNVPKSPFPVVTYKSKLNKTTRRVESLQDYLIFVRSLMFHVPGALDTVEKLNGVNEVSSEDNELVYDWPKYVDEQYTGRRVRVARSNILDASLDDYTVDGKVFAKTKNKLKYGNGVLMSVDEFMARSTEGLPYWSVDSHSRKTLEINPDTELIISQPVEFQSSNEGKLEYRTWVFNGEVIAIYGYDGTPTKVPDQVGRFANDFVSTHSESLPRHYVIDIGLTKSDEPILVEANDIVSSGNLKVEIFKKLVDSYLQSE